MAYYTLHFLSLLLPLVTVAVVPNCKTHCGNVEIPFPFGIGTECSLDDNFNVSCNTFTTPAKPYLTNVENRSEIIEINTNTSQIQVRYAYLAGARYEEEHEEADLNATETWTMVINLTQTPYTLSENNSITVVGCDDLVRFDGINSEEFAGCTSMCNKNTTVGNCPADGSSSNGCCQYPIPRGQAYLSLNFTDMHEHSRGKEGTRFFDWGYAFVGKKRTGPFSYKLDDLHNRTAFLIGNPSAMTSPLVLDWRMGNQNCTPELMNSPLSYKCKNNSHCLNFSQPEGYTCRCDEGYEGNPYLGCTDIDECKLRPSVCKSPSRCKNTVGGHECSCFLGYRYSDDRGCIPSKWINASIGVGSGIGFILILATCFCLRNIFQRTIDKKRKKKLFGSIINSSP